MANEDTTVVLGIPIPSTSPVFLAIIGVHVLFGLAAVIAGALAMLSKKGQSFIAHRVVRLIYSPIGTSRHLRSLSCAGATYERTRPATIWSWVSLAARVAMTRT